MATKSSGRKYGKAAGKSVESAVRREKRGTLKSGKGGKGGTVKSRKQAIRQGAGEIVQLALAVTAFFIWRDNPAPSRPRFRCEAFPLPQIAGSIQSKRRSL